jgi:hypothetical protein
VARGAQDSALLPHAHVERRPDLRNPCAYARRNRHRERRREYRDSKTSETRRRARGAPPAARTRSARPSVSPAPPATRSSACLPPLWSWSCTTAWRRVKVVMAGARITGPCAMPKGLRHVFGVNAFQSSVPPHLVQRWLGHASMKNDGHLRRRRRPRGALVCRADVERRTA